MNIPKGNKIPFLLRLAWAERFAQRHGSIRRSDFVDVWQISYAQASADLRVLLEIHPGCLSYDLHAKIYLWIAGDTLKTTIPHPVTGFSYELP